MDELINYNPQNPTSYSIVNVLADALDVQKHKCVVAGRVEAVLQYKSKLTECGDKLTIQLMGFNDNGINEYEERIGDEKGAIKMFLNHLTLLKQWYLSHFIYQECVQLLVCLSSVIYVHSSL